MAPSSSPATIKVILAMRRIQRLIFWSPRRGVKLLDLLLRETPAPMTGLFSRNLFAGQRIPLAGVAHQNGTIRFWRDPKRSALDVHCKAHELDNVYVVDGTFVPSSAAVNPGLTIMTNALRVGDHLIDRMK
jgi:choline dehydrogenase-like flavoprotein